MIPDRHIPDIFGDVRKFIAVAQPDLVSDLGAQPQTETLKLAKHLIDGEVNKELMPELEHMIENGTASTEQMVAFLDHCIDSIYVIAWAIEMLSLPGEAGWNEVQRANMSKFPIAPQFYGGGSGQVEYEGHTVDYYEEVRAGRIVRKNCVTEKVMKPEGFKPPDMHEIVMGIMQIRRLRNQPDKVATEFVKDYFNTVESNVEQGRNILP